jgi:hypothetical protein
MTPLALDAFDALDSTASAIGSTDSTLIRIDITWQWRDGLPLRRVTDCAGLVIAYSGGGEGDSIKEVLRACACALGGGRLGIAERLRMAGKDFRILLLRFKRNRIALSPLAYPI